MSDEATNTDHPLSDQERIARFRLARTENVGPVTFRQLLHRYGSGCAALDALPELVRRGGRARGHRVASPEDIERERHAAERLGAVDLHLGCDGYPHPLAAIDDAPPFLYVLGDPDLLQSDCIGMVGGRNASVAGKGFARKLAADLGHAGFTIASGMARGIDTAAHEGALETGTIAVLAGGVDVVFPPENEALHKALVERGAVISEMPPGMQPLARHFPRRNRIISGLSLAVAVIEAKRKSGSLITARRAAEQGRTVFAAPAAPMDVRGTGCNDLIRDGATLVQSADDILQDMPASFGDRPGQTAGTGLSEIMTSGGDEPDESEILTAHDQVERGLSSTPVAVDSLIRELRLPAPLVNAVLLEMELAGTLTRHPGGFISR
ncbi:DNA-processing protein DprA [Hwanghaeella sp.]|uniref:DNA-processing protein DprA n=1 Tax=Hwanghaeella sp. TaxID=2605943 RepID=UPI003CCB748E